MILLDTYARRAHFARQIPTMLEFIDRVRDRGEGVLVHCYHGLDRTGAVLASYLVAREGHTPLQAVRAVRRVQPLAMSAEGYDAAVTVFAQLYPALGGTSS